MLDSLAASHTCEHERELPSEFDGQKKGVVMKLLRNIAVTFAQYSRIPVPRFDWEEDDMTYNMSFFPLVGGVIGLLYIAVFAGCSALSVPPAATALLMTAVPVLVTGGFHIDGFMDTADALSSYGSREEKLRILSDPHIGAFSVIRLALCGLIYIASSIIIVSFAYTEGHSTAVIYTTAAGFVLSRGLSAVAVLSFRSAKNEGMLYYEASSAAPARGANMSADIIWIALASAVMLNLDMISGILIIASCLLVFIWYKHMSYRQLGGITGDTAGWFVTVCETAVMLSGAAAAVISSNM